MFLAGRRGGGAGGPRRTGARLCCPGLGGGAPCSLPRLVADARGRGRPVQVRRPTGCRPRGRRASPDSVRAHPRDRALPMDESEDEMSTRVKGGSRMHRLLRHRLSRVVPVVSVAALLVLSASSTSNAASTSSFATPTLA